MGALDLNLLILAAAGVLLAGLAAVKASYRLGTPVLLLFVALGVAAGEAGLGLRFDDADLTVSVGTLLLAVILWDGGFATKTRQIRSVAARSMVLATVGVMISVAVTSALVYVVLPVDLRTALILGSVASSTDAAATFAVLRTVPVVRRVRTTLEAESGLNDPPVIVLVSVVVSDAWDQMSPWGMAGMAVYQLTMGAVLGAVVAVAGVALLRVTALPASGLYPLANVAIGMVAFAGAGHLGASGLLACYVAGLVVGNARLPHERTTQGFVEALAWLAQMGLFVMLGLLASPERLPGAVPMALVVGAALTFVARPVSVLACLTPFRVRLAEQAFIAWGGLRGAVPIVLAAVAMSADVPGAMAIFDVVFVLVIMFTLIQGPTLPWAARATGVARRGDLTGLTFESAPLDKGDLVALQMEVPERSRIHGVTVAELRLPPTVALPLIIREGEVLVPEPSTVLRHGDDVVLTAPARQVDLVQRRLREVGRFGRLAGWSR